MPRGRPKKTAAQVELLPPEENDQPKIREIKHKTEWIEAVPVEETPEGDDDLEDVEIEDKPRKKTRNAIQEMRKKLRAQGVTPTSNLRLYIERYVHSETDAGGSWAETEFCTKYSTTEEHIFNKDYIDAARKWGPGKYRITIRMDNRIVDAFDERISTAPTTPVIQHINPNDPNSPQVIVQSDGQQTVMPSIKDIMKVQREALKEQLEMAKLMREAYGFAPETPQSQQPVDTDPEIAALRLIAKNPDVMEKIGAGIAKTVLGSKAGDDTDPWAEVAKEAIRSGQASEIVASLIREIMAPFRNMWGNQNNGQAPMAQTQVQNQQAEQASIPEGVSQSGEGMGAESVARLEDASVGQEQPVMAPEEHALQVLIENCRRQVPVKIAFDRLIAYADMLNEQAPQYSIDGYISEFALMTPDQAIEFVKTQPNGEAVASLPHAQQWTAELQRLIKEAGQEGEE